MLGTHGSWCCDGWLSPDGPIRDAQCQAAQVAHPVRGRPRRTYPASIEMPACAVIVRGVPLCPVQRAIRDARHTWQLVLRRLAVT
eukprot:5011348-Prymnesium_polylepis.1